MKINFGQIYPEVDVNYEITNTVLDILESQLGELNKSIEHYEKLFKTNDFLLELIISATKKNSSLAIKGPTTLSKRKTVEFVFFIPFKEFKSYFETISYILDCIAEGIAFVFNKYKTDPSGVNDVIERIKNLIVADPDKYQKWTK